MVLLLVASLIGFGWVDQMFFPAAARPQFMVDYWAPEGTRIQQVSRDMRELEEKLIGDPRVQAVSTFIGQGPPRFYLPVDPESPYPSYGQLIVNTESFGDVEGLFADLQPWIDTNVPEAVVILRKFGLGPYETWPVEARQLFLLPVLVLAGVSLLVTVVVAIVTVMGTVRKRREGRRPEST